MLEWDVEAKGRGNLNEPSLFLLVWCQRVSRKRITRSRTGQDQGGEEEDDTSNLSSKTMGLVWFMSVVVR